MAQGPKLPRRKCPPGGVLRVPWVSVRRVGEALEASSEKVAVDPVGPMTPNVEFVVSLAAQLKMLWIDVQGVPGGEVGVCVCQVVGMVPGFLSMSAMSPD